MSSPSDRERRLKRNDSVTPGWVEFERRLEYLRTNFELNCDIEQLLPNALKNKYKNREVVGNLLHFAIDYDATISESETIGENVSLVLEQGARVDAWMIANAFGQESKVTPIHLAATRGLIPAVRLLVEYAADINQKSMHAGELHFCPIHDAAFAQNYEAVECLLQLRASPNMSNKDGRYPLHIVAENGADEVAELLIEARARLDVELPAPVNSLANTTPFNLAIQRRMFPKERLHLLAPFCYPDYDVNFFHCMVDTCKDNIPAAKALVRSILGDGAESSTEVDALRRDRVVKAVKQGCSKGVSPIPSLTEIIKLAPDVASAILDIFLVTPKATVPSHHALPRVANLADGIDVYGDFRLFSTPVPMFTTYSSDVEWKFQSNVADRAKQIPPWHHKLVPRPRSDEDDCEVQVKYLSFPNILDVRVLHALNSTRDKKVFAGLTVQALTRCSWQCVENAVWMQIIFEAVIILINSWWAMTTLAHVPIEPTFQDKNPLLAFLNTLLALVPVQNVTRSPLDDEPYAVRTFHHKMAVTAMSVLWASTFRETFNVVCHMVEHRSWGFRWLNIFSGYNILELLGTVMLGLFLVIYGARGANNVTNLFLCVNILIRAVKLLIKLCLTQPVGREILPIIESFLPMGRFFFFASSIYFTFGVAFASLRGNYSIHHVMTLLFFATWAGDGDSFIGLRQLDNDGNLSLVLLGLAVVAFTVCTLNLMIAIFSKVYKENYSEATLLFLQHRCQATERVLLEFSWKSECRRWHEEDAGDDQGQGRQRRDRLPYIISLVLFAVWSIAIALGSPGPFAIWLAAFLAASMVLLQAASMQNTWFNRDYHRQRLTDGLCNSSRLVNGMPVASWMRSDSRDVQMRSRSPMQEYDQALTTEAPEDRLAEYLREYEDDFFIWICHRADFEQATFGKARDELREMIVKLNSSIQKVSTRLNEMDASMVQLEHRVCGSTKRRLSGVKNLANSTVQSTLIRSGTKQNLERSGSGNLAFARSGNSQHAASGVNSHNAASHLGASSSQSTTSRRVHKSGSN